jgi:hypothetical protein
MQPWLAGIVMLAIAMPASAQLLPGGIGQLPGQTLGTLTPMAGSLGSPLGGAAVSRVASEPLGIGGFVDGAGIPDARSLLALRRDRLRALVRSNAKLLVADPEGNPVRRDELLALGLSDVNAAAIRAAGFTVVRDDRADTTGQRLTVLQPRHSLAINKALAALRVAAPGVQADYNHVYEPAGGPLQPGGTAAAHIAIGGVGGTTIGLVDGGVGAHASLANARIEQRGFAGPVQATGHGTAIASLLVGDAPGFQGAAQVADVYGGSAGNGSAEAMARGLNWLGDNGARVINISLVGPPNLLIERSIAALQARGVIVVAAVGNDGPAAPPLYPASYDRVVAVTAVDARDRVLVEAGRARHIDFAAPGADLAAALQKGGYAIVRGTSFAAPLVAARLAVNRGDALAMVTAEARPMRDDRTGKGIVCGACRNDIRGLSKKNRRGVEEAASPRR